MFAVSNYYRYELVVADSEEEAVQRFTNGERLKKLEPEQVDDAVIAAMCCRYDGEVQEILEGCRIDIDRVLLMDIMPCTNFYTFDV
ncbi:TPA: hypothetical protein RQK93_004006 [Vibrio vulnificus]|uniref:hypothetical protein n=1 Tax=Vibrio vulnificus TaxID=672 RepID=UPI0015FD2CEB|nr:hypothetical protein [Vibrio vulnificus]EJA3295921.1 hypothetical protein [Vibrio vulnificus]MBN8156005.1 hypothetical protein [Vibrio vulnificus]QMV35579.1 hypothetical protein F6X00_03385 [Vibrio vulnificus]HAS6045393.1 hypothetical protein [Vibrio vulnificus]HAS6409452.1 hypothetical protein [Vibrio vulnificus]